MSLAAFLAAGFAFEARACGEGARRAGDRRRLVAGIGGHWRALAGIGGRGGGGDFGEIRGRSFRHACWAWGVAFVGRSGFACRRADEPTSRRADEPTSRRADEPTSRRADEPTSRHADEPTSRRADEPTSRHADGSTVPSVYESIPVSPMQSRRLADSPIHRFTDLPIYRFASACRAAVPRPSGAERSIIGSRVHTTPTRRPPAVARPFEAARRRRHIRRASRPTAVHSLEAHRRRKP
ncbi:Probable hemoglobin and hemoglobin-haptoglobin-binding protein 3 precursor [Burkholderia pseudomallei]|nr:Probable hemoglobin and hemoglobin-haptoglobin-binding protein 3 precursor [Burkholderia pseudomallei]CAJ3405998.1 Probable hemoglobin and hemoglobin-haptoglobin-binding protein 3 precursor [Burkholderia pseudomallei]CAJ4170838.1 Probable hemoglobin and hemoglobin-haptoglobin-binding protein 3 precursor [Burkholderia pseudomallei]CAJ4529636.1 Probable hemoglobin and hemoglobin-haptoglobin-binding protein 3 precursor [Burkholderia pseudomallei]CAJ6609621.1 Probable hemoglobin and hemoglobin-h